MKKIGILLVLVVAVLTCGNLQAQQYDPYREYRPHSYDGMLSMTNDLMQQTRILYLTAEREYPRYRSDNYLISLMYRLYDESATFRKRMERNFDNPEALRRSYQRLYSAWYNLDYAMRRTNRFGYLNDEFRNTSYLIHQLGRSVPGVDNRDMYDDYDDYDRD